MKKPTKTKKSKRSKVKWPNLRKDYNLKARRDYIEPDYINGVKDSKGNQVMRALTNEEKDWLDQFYKETVNADLRNPEFYKTKEEKKKIYGENNARNRCLYNQTKKTGKLVKVDPKEYDKKTLKRLQGYDLEHVIVNDNDNKEEDN
jgi:hypothetical protein